MSWDTVNPEAQTLGEPVRNWLHTRHRKAIKINEAIESSLPWRPTLHFEANEFSIIAADVKVTPCPESLVLTKTRIANAHLPITIYSICSETAYLTKDGQKEARELKAHGLGLFTVDVEGIVTKQFSGIPISNHIPLAEIDALLVDTKRMIALRIKDAFESYNSKPSDGITAISDVLESLVYSAVTGAIRKNWMAKGDKKLQSAKVLDTMFANAKFSPCKAAIGSARGFLKDYRNTANHSPRSRKQAYNKYMKCKQGFFAGIQTVDSFYTAMKKIGLNPK